MLLWLIGCFQISEGEWSTWKETQACDVDDADCDGYSQEYDCDDNDKYSTFLAVDADCDGVLTAADCNDSDPNSTAIVDDGDCDGVLTEDDCDDSDANTVNDMDCDGVLTEDDCDDTNAADASFWNDCDLDGVQMEDDCDDNDAGATIVSIDSDCDGVLTADDCDDSDPSDASLSGDCDQDGVLTVDDCDDSDPNNLSTPITNPGCPVNLDLGGGESIDMVLIPAGADPLGRYTLTNDFYLMTTEVTQGMFFALMGYHSYNGQATSDSTYGSYGVGAEYPAYHTSWHMAADFANQLTQRHNAVHETNLQECYSCISSGTTSVSCTEAINPYQCNGYVLPTDAEWEYAARSGTMSDFWTSNEGGNYSADTCDGTETIQDGSNPEPLLRNYSWYCGNNDNAYGVYGSKEVAGKLPNDFGLYDMHGNLWEWSADWHGCSFPSNGTDPYCSLVGSSRVKRGGGWSGSPGSMRTANRGSSETTFRYFNIGYRIALHP